MNMEIASQATIDQGVHASVHGGKKGIKGFKELIRGLRGG